MIADSQASSSSQLAALANKVDLLMRMVGGEAQPLPNDQASEKPSRSNGVRCRKAPHKGSWDAKKAEQAPSTLPLPQHSNPVTVFHGKVIAS